MSQETNKEMDLLLRRLGRRHDEPASNGEGHVNHLDADELSAYAENALPAAARARYTEHLAECTRCRELVVSLSGSAGVAVARETATVAEPSGFRKLLASLFSPMVLRYAAPAIGLILIAVIGLIVLRRPEVPHIDFVAQAPREEPVQSPPASQPPTQSSSVSTYNVDKDTASAKPDAQQKSGEQPAPVPNAPPAVSVTAEVRQDAASGAAAQPLAKESPAAPKAADATDEIKSKAESEARKEENAGRMTVANEPPPPRERTAEQDTERHRADALATASARKRSLGGIASAPAAGRGSVQRDSAADKDNNSAETRSAGGRRFRKEGSVWIDTAYDSSRSIMTLARGSEQFRALVADEPAIKSIADQLDGEFIVVWKGRTYRIR